MATAHLLHGFVGAGKTTFARRLEGRLPAVRFTHDEWMHKLYGPNPPASEFADLYDRVDGLIWRYAICILECGRDVILDFGFWTRKSRDEARRRISATGAEFVLYDVRCDQAEMMKRVAARSSDIPADSLWINEAAVKEFRARFEPLDPDEDCTDIDGMSKG